MRTEPVKCNFKALLAKDAPATCGEGFTEDVLWSEDFEDGLAGWTTEQRGRLRRAASTSRGSPWPRPRPAPVGRTPSKVAFGPAPDEGQCTNGAGRLLQP